MADVEHVADPDFWRKRYPDVFPDGLGTVTGMEAKLHLKPEAVPKYCKPRPVPFALKPAVDNELQKMEA